MKAISIMQPWAHLIVNGHKDIENRTWRTRYRGLVLIHAGKKVEHDAILDLRNRIHPVTGLPFDVAATAHFETGGIVGEAEIIDCLEDSASPWFVGRFGFVIRNARPLPFRPCKGALGFFTPEFPASDSAEERT